MIGEILLISIIIILQLFIFIRTYSRIKKVAHTFYDLEFIKFILPFKSAGLKLKSFNLSSNENQPNDIIQIDVEGSGGIYEKIVSPLNEYLERNSAKYTDFHVIKDITDRNLEAEFENIQNAIPSPLYWGLAATMFGIITGLLSMPDLSSSGAEIDEVFNALNPLIDRVKFAMIASVSGLILTTLLATVVYHGIPNLIENGKTAFLSFIQAELLPRLPKDQNSEVAELNQKLASFTSGTASIVDRLDDMVERIEEVVQEETKLINQIENVDLKGVSQANLKVFKSLSEMMDDFDKFAQYFHTVNATLNNVRELNDRFSEYLDKTDDMESIFNKIDETVTLNNDVSNYLNEHVSFFDEHDKFLKTAVEGQQEMLSTAVTNSNLSLEKGITELSNATTQLIATLQETIPDYQRDMDNILNQWQTSFQEQAEEHVRLMNQAYQEAHPRFENLNKLESIDQSLIQLTDLQHQNGRVDKQTELLGEIRNRIGEVSSNGSHSDLAGSIQSAIKEALISSKVSKKEKYISIARTVFYISGSALILFTLVKEIIELI